MNVDVGAGGGGGNAVLSRTEGAGTSRVMDALRDECVPGGTRQSRCCIIGNSGPALRHLRGLDLLSSRVDKICTPRVSLPCCAPPPCATSAHLLCLESQIKTLISSCASR